MPLTVEEVATHLAALAALGADLEGTGIKMREDAQRLRESVERSREDGTWTPAERRRVIRAAWRLGNDAAPVAAQLAPLLGAFARDVLD